MLNEYTGYMWWDNETDGKLMYPKHQKTPTPTRSSQAAIHNPEATAARGLWSKPLSQRAPTTSATWPARISWKSSAARNSTSTSTHTQFADFHGHGWVFRAVFKQDRHGRICSTTPATWCHPAEADPRHSTGRWPMRSLSSQRTWHISARQKPVHLKDIHLEKGMQCVDCHFEQDAHGDGNLYGETRNAVRCNASTATAPPSTRPTSSTYLFDTSNQKACKEACSSTAAKVESGLHPTPDRSATGKPTKAAADYNKKMIDRISETALRRDRRRAEPALQSRRARQTWNSTGRDRPAGQLSTTDPTSWWSTLTPRMTKSRIGDGDATTRPVEARTIPRPSIAPSSPDMPTPSAPTIRAGAGPSAEDVKSGKQLPLAHPAARMSCYACHTSWNTSCFGCHLPQRANQRMPMLHNEGVVTRNYTNYNYQTLRDDMYMLGGDSTTQRQQDRPRAFGVRRRW